MNMPAKRFWTTFSGSLFWLTAGWGFPREDANPFPMDARPDQIALHDIPRTIERNQEGEFERLVFQGSVDGQEITMWMSEEESDLIVDGDSKFSDRTGHCGGPRPCKGIEGSRVPA